MGSKRSIRIGRTTATRANILSRAANGGGRSIFNPFFFASLRLMTGWNVSCAKAATAMARIEKKTNVHCVQRHPLRFTTKAPITGLHRQLEFPKLLSILTHPNPGPKKGMSINTADTGPLFLGVNVSDKVPGATARTGAQHKPAMKRKKHSAPILCTKPAPMVNTAPIGTLAA
ncbi:hypothetical protein HG531_013764 [Fusarium graminearum]|nr:hypothetical protein HG531_013764 [Fusarium graminearum]